MRTVLLVTYHFPPLNDGASIGIAKLVKFLPEFGWQVIVVTVDERWISSPQYSEVLLNELKSGVQIVRTPMLRPTAEQVGVLRSEDRKLVSRVQFARARLANWLLIPEDYGFLWLPYAMPKALRLATGNIDAVWTTSPPHNLHILGLTIRRLKGLPWLVDLRDGWCGNPLFTPKLGIRRRFEYILEAFVMQYASRVTCRVDSVAKRVQTRYGPQVQVSVVPNGFDEDDFSNKDVLLEAQALKSDKFTITHVGILGSNRSPKAFLEGVRIFLDRCPDAVEHFQLVNVGGIEPRWVEVASHLGIEQLVVNVPNVPHPRAVAYLLASDVLWLLQVASDGGADAIPGKAYEYLAAKKPILGTVCRGATYDFLSSVGVRSLTEPDDVEQIASQIQHLFMSWVHDTLDLEKPMSDAANRYTRRNSAEQFANLLNEISAQSVKRVKR